MHGLREQGLLFLSKDNLQAAYIVHFCGGDVVPSTIAHPAQDTINGPHEAVLRPAELQDRQDWLEQEEKELRKEEKWLKEKEKWLKEEEEEWVEDGRMQLDSSSSSSSEEEQDELKQESYWLKKWEQRNQMLEEKEKRLEEKWSRLEEEGKQLEEKQQQLKEEQKRLLAMDQQHPNVQHLWARLHKEMDILKLDKDILKQRWGVLKAAYKQLQKPSNDDSGDSGAGEDAWRFGPRPSDTHLTALVLPLVTWWQRYPQYYLHCAHPPAQQVASSLCRWFLAACLCARCHASAEG